MIQESDYQKIMDVIQNVHGTAWQFICYHEMEGYSFDTKTTRELAQFLYDAFMVSSASDFSLTEAGNYLAKNRDKLLLYDVAPDYLYDLYTGYTDMEELKLRDEVLPAEKPGLDQKIFTAKSDSTYSAARNEKERDTTIGL